MKNKQQIVAFLKATRTREIKDELAIESFLARRGIYVKFDESKKRGHASHSISFEDFEKWFDRELPGKGDAIVIGDTIGIVQGLGFDSIILGVSLAGDGGLVTSAVKIPETDFRKADRAEMIRLQQEMNRAKLLWNKFNNEPAESILPADNLQLRVSLLGERVAVGVFREINNKGEIVMYCMKENGKPVRHSLYEIAGKASDYQLEHVNTQDRAMLAGELEKAGKVWNGHAKRIEPVGLRVEKGRIYYYIDDFWDIIAVPDNYRPRDRKRLRRGNYYRNRHEAEKVLGLMVEERNRQLAETASESTEKKRRKKKR
ncbi:MAG: hypothetical protein LBV74_13080 [Tannerella sp.]|jgi:hypothetical protein|nr:hypothetical protein [Tannerella sp.]